MAKQPVLWVVEVVDAGFPWSEGYRTRDRARGYASGMRDLGYVARVVKYIREN
ncbi:hypothetical protein D3C87_2103560 [compost metagenome]